MTGDSDIGNPIISLIVHSAIAYIGALTAKFSGRVNQQDHSGAIKALRAAWEPSSAIVGFRARS